jgi:hypothetical protein
MAGLLAKLVTMIVLSFSGGGNVNAVAQHVSARTPMRVQLPTVVCTPAWGTIVLPICV